MVKPHCTPGQGHLFGGCVAAESHPKPKPTLAAVRLADARADDLAESAAELLRLVGLPATLTLIERWPGMRLFVPGPARMRPEHPIAAAIGHRLAQRLAVEMGGSSIPVPSPRRVLASVTRRAVAQARGVYPGSVVARAYGVTEHYVYRIWSETR
jgi:hypothetical protein